LSVSLEQLAGLTRSADRVCQEIDASAARVQGAAEALDRLSASIATVCQTLDQAATDAAEAREKVLSVDPDLDVDRLTARAQQLHVEVAAAIRMLDADRPGAARAAERLDAAVSAIAEDAAEAADAAAAPLVKRRELRGRLDAYRAKAVSTGRAEDLGLEDLFRSAQDALYQAPCDLEEAGRRVAAYQRALLRPVERERCQ
jgi:hypothetical protein